jgi:hypothetical protein
MTEELIVKENPEPLGKLGILILALYFGGIALEVIITGIALLFKSNFLSDSNGVQEYLKELGILSTILILLMIGLIFVIIYSFGFILKIFSKEKPTQDTWILVIIIFIIALYIVSFIYLFPNFTLLHDPFNFRDTNPSLASIFDFLWYSGFCLVTSLIFLIFLVLSET